ncbi:LLM class flavin-dependent oxidoreductase, partial [Escherichia coli]|nr:LLM class flavin-dependent oxidoreductase [Escherichia coli]
AMCSDHFMPWSRRQGHSGFSLSWLGAALASTEFSIGSVNAPGQRYHPAVIAQATATLGEMFPGRYWVALGAGQAMNEHITGDRWPDLDTRRRRLEESADIIRRLHRGE